MAEKTSLFLLKLTSLSHLKERTQKNCLNCNAQVYGKYCHICGQENVEPQESVWHLVTHFFNDITHFDGKFFSTLQLLITKPGFLSSEYRMGRRVNYLNPVRMYIFTSFVFFFIFFSFFKAEETLVKETVGNTPLAVIQKMDSSAFSEFTRTINSGIPMSKAEFEQYLDSSRRENIISFDVKYKSRAEYDSLLQLKMIREGWLLQKLRHKGFELNEKYKNRQGMMLSNLSQILAHNFPQMLFISLPLFAWFLHLLYLRQKAFYFVSHGIYTVHLYIFYFIIFFVMMVLNKLSGYTHWSWLEVLSNLLIGVLFVYEYKAMRNFYGQGRGKTILKFLLAGLWRLIIVMVLFVVFLFLSLLKV